MLRCFDIFGQFFRFRFDVLVVQEDTDQCAGLVGMSQRDKAFIFQHQSFFTTKTRSGFDGFHRGDRRRIMLPGGLRDHAFGDGETHRRFNFAEFQRLQLRLTFRFPVQVALNRLAQDRQRAVAQFFRSDHAIHQADFQRLLGADIFPGSNDLQRAVGAEQTRQTN